jgi:3-isopropylmalate/(R)-2-methylmalate dehydratase small subunit
MEAIHIHTGVPVPLDRSNVDTDQIIPKQFLKRIERTGYGDFLFYDWRYSGDGTPDSSFILNQPRYAGASVLLAGRNFGCGSSREHAVWALHNYGFRVVIAPSFADIFANNCLKNGLAAVTLTEAEVHQLMNRARDIQDYRVTLDLEHKLITDSRGFEAPVAIGDFQRHCLINGLDDIELSLQHTEQIAAFESRRKNWMSIRA